MRVFFVAALLVATASEALAADLPQSPPPQAPAVYTPAPPAAYNWTGFYVGANAGYAFGNGNRTASIVGPITGTATGTGDINGAVAGGQIGANFQMNALVLGIEGDFDWSGQSVTNTYNCIGCTLNETIKLPWIATVRGRVGFALDRVLFYGTGGVAFTDLSETLNGACCGGAATISQSSTNVGWTGGAGIEWAFAQNWSVRAEYLYVRFDNISLSGAFPAIATTISETGTLNDNIVRAGINFKYP